MMIKERFPPEEEGWGLPVTGTLKAWAMEYSQKKLMQDHRGWPTQPAAVAMASRDKNVQRRMQALTI